MTKQKEFKKICENWDAWVSERRVGDMVDPDDQTSGYMRTKSGDVEKVASMPRDDGQSYSKADVDPESAGNVNLKKQQKQRGMEFRDARDELVSLVKEFGEEWNGNPAASFLFKIPGAKGAPKNYSWGNFAVDLGILVASVVPPLAGVLAAAGNAVKAGAAAKIAASPNARALVFSAALKAPKAVEGAMKVAGHKILGTKVIDYAAQKPVLLAAQAALNKATNDLQDGKKGIIPFRPEHILEMIRQAKKRGKLNQLMQDKGFVAAAKQAGVLKAT